ncbi:hypothetical protein [Hymenobacter sp. YC55]|uniref:hypothetical protein n=1 Tax=Hymenobacter sp. YC55 TaxID=3034019 RepID=UPI0023F80335|nr:hypothetical protein [Hymenobacter sp. YC55]MDF7813611.1 hypothetical protein [Hymenobacter sp. YC55]
MAKAKKTPATEGATSAPNYDAYFEANPETDTLYVSSDGQVFTHEGWCKSHVKFLEDKNITTIERETEEVDAEEEETPAV